MSILWNFVSTERKPENRLSKQKIQLLSKAVLDSCDRMDGVADGLIGNPDACSFDPRKLTCFGADRQDCLTAAEVRTALQLYQGPVDPQTGKSVYPGMPKGSEPWWDRLGADASGQPPYSPIFAWALGRNWKWQNFNFGSDAKTMSTKLGPVLNATNTDLRAFRDRGHKLLVYHGWADWLVVPEESIRFHQAMETGPTGKNMDRFYRLFMAPGVTHCSGGTGPDQFDALGAVVDWVEKGHAPEKIIATQAPNAEHPQTPKRSRPLCPYPATARYSGHGSTDDAANFTCVTAASQ